MPDFTECPPRLVARNIRDSKSILFFPQGNIIEDIEGTLWLGARSNPALVHALRPKQFGSTLP